MPPAAAQEVNEDANAAPLEYYPHAAPAVAIAACGFVLTMVTYCYLEDRRIKRERWLMKLITLYDVLLVGFYAAQAYMCATFLSEQDTLTGFGSFTTAAARTWIRVHAYSRFLHVVDTVYPLYRSNRGQISYALVWHNAWILPLWGLVLDNDVLLRQGYVLFVAMLMSLMYCVVYAYLAVSAWQICITPGAHLTTSFQVTVYCALFVHSGVAFYLSGEDDSDVRMLSAALWGVYHLGMTVAVMKLMWKKRPLQCWPSMQMRDPRPTVGGHGVPSA